MARILLFLSIVATLATAGLGWVTKDKVAGLQKNLETAKGQATTAQQSLTKTQSTLKKTEEDLTAARETLEAREAEVAKQKGERERLETEMTQAKENLDRTTTELAKLKDDMSKIPTNKDGIGGENPAQKIEEMNRLLTEKTAAEAEAKQVQTTLQSRLDEAQEKLQNSERQLNAYKENIVPPGLSGRIVHYEPSWGFAVLNIGDRKGVKANKTMIVTRDNRMVGKVKVTSVEPETSIADVIPGTVPRGMAVQAGDKVVFEGARGGER